MPVYEYRCEPCRTVYRVQHGMSETPAVRCPACGRAAERLLSAPRLSRGYSSPTQARYAGLSDAEEVAREGELQKTYRTVWLPPEVKHAPPWADDEHH